MKFKHNIIILFTLIFINLPLSCSKDKNPVNSTGSNSEFSIDKFPQQVGASWTYKVYNNLIDCSQFVDCFDTCTVTIIDSLWDRGGFIKSNWWFNYPNQEEIYATRLNQNKLSIQWHNPNIFFFLEFPLSVGNSWLENYWDLESYIKVVGLETITIDAGKFENAYHLTGQTGQSIASEAWFTFDLWIVKGLGIIKLQFSSTRNSVSETWVLQSYIPDKPIEPFSIDKFPSYDGMTWTYERFDFNKQIYDTILVQIAESSTVALWNYSCIDSSWQEIVSKEGSFVNFFHPENIIEPFKTYHFPLELDSSWITNPIGSSSEIISLSVVTLSFGRFFPSYNIETRYLCDVTCIARENEWVYPNIGILHKSIYIPDDGLVEIWWLIDYSNP